MFSISLKRIFVVAFSLALGAGSVGIAEGLKPQKRSHSVIVQQTPDSVSIQPSSGKRPGRKPVTVYVDRSRVRVGEAVRFTLRPPALTNNSNPTISVDFGDGTGYQTRQNEVSHRYTRTGHYKVYASVADTGNGTTGDPLQQPVPRVTLSVNPTQALANSRVSFTAQLSFNYPGVKYRFNFGDGSQTDWQDSAFATHSYATAGSYSAYVDLGLSEKGIWRQSGGSARKSVVVSSPFTTTEPKRPVEERKEPLPGPVKLTANPKPVQTGKPVTFRAQAQPTNSSVRYLFRFGDGSSTGWQESSQATHTYKSPGKFSASVGLGLSSNGSIRRLSRDAASIAVSKEAPIEVDFEVTPIPLQKGQPATFVAKANSSDANLRYRFVFGDNSSPTEWQSGPNASYKYAEPGNYSAHVEIGKLSNGRVAPIGSSSPRVISVGSSALALASPQPGSTSNPGSSPGASPGASPGDSSGPLAGGSPGASPGSSPTTSPATLGPGGPVAPTTNGSPTDPSTTNSSTTNSPNSSSPTTNWPAINWPTINWPAGLRNNWWVYLLIALLLLFVAFQFYKALFVPRTTFHANRDMGSSELDPESRGLSINSEVLLRRNVAEGQYMVHTDEPNIVRSVRRENV